MATLFGWGMWPRRAGGSRRSLDRFWGTGSGPDGLLPRVCVGMRSETALITPFRGVILMVLHVA